MHSLCEEQRRSTKNALTGGDGSVYFLNTGMTHWAENNGNEGRIHLVVSLNGQQDITYD